MLLFWLGLVIYGSLKLRTYILIARDQVVSVVFVCYNTSKFYPHSSHSHPFFLTLVQNAIMDMFRFITFWFQYVTYLVQLVVSIISDVKGKKKYEILTEVSVYSCPNFFAFLNVITFIHGNYYIATEETLSGGRRFISLSYHMVVAD